MTPKESIMTETMEKNPIKQSIQSWSCGRYHRHRYFPQIGDKMSNDYSVQKVVTVEDMGRSLPRIYTTMYNN
jgi:hypothetical protein